MDTTFRISIKELKLNYPGTWNAVNERGTVFLTGAGSVKIETFLDRNGYSMGYIPIDEKRVQPYTNYNGCYAGTNEHFRYQDFKVTTSVKKARKQAVMYALLDFEQRC